MHLNAKRTTFSSYANYMFNIGTSGCDKNELDIKAF